MKSIRYLILTALACGAALMLSNCASVVYPSKQPVVIKTIPEGANLLVDGRTLVSPATVELKGKSEYLVQATKKGYKTSSTKIDSDVRILASVVGNIFNFTGLIGIAVDFLGTGAAYKLQNSVVIPLRKA